MLRTGNFGRLFAVLAVVSLALAATPARAETLRLLTWGGYAPEDVVQGFTKETGIEVKVTVSNNEEMISKLRATGGAGFDLAQPSQDRVAPAQIEFGIYRPIDLGQIDQDQFIGSMLESTKANTTVDGKVYGVPHIWGTSGLVVNTAEAKGVSDYLDLCDPALKGRVTYRLKRPTLIAFAFSMGQDPFALYGNTKAYEDLMNRVAAKLIECKANVKAYWQGGDHFKELMRSGEAVAAMAWDGGGWDLTKENEALRFVAPKSGALGWVDTFVLPAKSANEAAAYKWINYVMRPDVAAKITAHSSYMTAARGADALLSDQQKQLFNDSFSPANLDNIRWYPPVPAGLEDIEGKILDRVKAAAE